MAGSQHGVRLEPEQLIEAARARPAGPRPSGRRSTRSSRPTERPSHARDGAGRAGQPLVERELPDPEPGKGQVLIEVSACAVCRTDLHIFDGELTEPKLPLVPGHMIVGRVAGRGEGATGSPRATGSASPGWAGPTGPAATAARVARTSACRASSPATTSTAATPSARSPTSASASRSRTPTPTSTPRRCSAAGLIGYRSLRLAGEGERLGMYGFGSSAHLICQVAVAPGLAGLRADARGRHREAGAGALARRRLGRRGGRPGGVGPGRGDHLRPGRRARAGGAAALAPGGTVVCAGIHMSDIPSFPYEMLWHERTVRSVANLTRRDGEEFIAAGPEVPVRDRDPGLSARRGQPCVG